MTKQGLGCAPDENIKLGRASWAERLPDREAEI